MDLSDDAKRVDKLFRKHVDSNGADQLIRSYTAIGGTICEYRGVNAVNCGLFLDALRAEFGPGANITIKSPDGEKDLLAMTVNVPSATAGKERRGNDNRSSLLFLVVWLGMVAAIYVVLTRPSIVHS